MPYWSIAEWRARIGSSWCTLGRPVKSKSCSRRGSGWVQRVLTMNQVVTMMIMMIMLIGINLGLHAIISGGYCPTLASECPVCRASLHTSIDNIIAECLTLHIILADLLPGGTLSLILYLLNSGYLLFVALRNCAPLLYQLFTIILKRSLREFCYNLIPSLCFSAHFIHRLLFLICPLMHPVRWLILFGKKIRSQFCASIIMI